MIYNIYIFDTTGSCLYYHEWTREHDAFKSNRDEEKKLIFGLIFSLKQFIKTLSPNPEAEEGLHCFKTKTYTLYHLDTPSGLRFIVNTDNETPDMTDALWHIYDLFIEYVVKNPLWKVGTEVKLPIFTANLSAYVSSLC
ncbi:hypothetical protein WA158_006416 [Blastocystis sp. Blastoise]